MNEHAGPACALSGLIVGLFAILLHDRNPPPPVPSPPARNVLAHSKAEGSKPEALPAIARARPVATLEPTPKAEAPPPRPDRALVVPEPKAAEPGPRQPRDPQARSAPLAAESRVSTPARATTPRSSFTVVEAGESLADVAARVYGSKEASEALWKANRDQVERVDSPLARGTLLRTP